METQIKVKKSEEENTKHNYNNLGFREVQKEYT